MTRFSYTLNSDTNKVVKNIKETFPDLEILDRGLKVKRSTDTIKKGLLKAYQGEAEKFLVSVEENWFEAQSEIQDLTEELDNLRNPVLAEDENGVDIPLTEEEIAINDLRIKEIVGYDTITVVPDAADITVHTDGALEIATAKRDELETQYEWLKAYRGITTTVVRPEPAETATIPDDKIKTLIAHERDLKVRDLNDTVADLAKMNSLLFSMVGSMYDVMAAADKDNIPAAERAVIEYALTSFATVQTRADRQLATEGTDLVDKLFSRETAIADIIDSLKA